MARFLERHGSRGPNEWDIAADPWELKPERVLAAIGAMRSASDDHDPHAQRDRLATERAAATETVRAVLNPVDRWLFNRALAATTLFSQARERSKTTVIRALHSIRLAHRTLAERISAWPGGGGLSAFDTCLLTGEDLAEVVAIESVPDHLLAAIAERRGRYEHLSSLVPPFIFEGEISPPDDWAAAGAAAVAATVGTTLQGIAGCPGVARGRARVITDPGEPGNLGPGDVLIAPITDPSWTPLFLAAEAVVVDMGATMSHAVIVSRELGIPCVVSAVGATSSIPDGAIVDVDGNAGTVTVVELP
jgi:pyruvate,water dikinase